MTETTPNTAVLTSIMLAIFRTNGRLLQAGDGLTAPLGLTSARWQVLGAISLPSAPQTVPQIAETMGQTRQGAQKQVNALEAEGLLQCLPNPRHKRSSLYALTEQGAAAYQAISQRFAIWVNAVASDMQADTLSTTLALLQQLETRIANLPPTKGTEP